MQLVGEAGPWSVVPIQWPNQVVWEATRETTSAYVLCSDQATDAELVALLRSRAAPVPLIVVGSEPHPDTAPNLWFPTAPPAALLGVVLGHLLGAAPPAALALAWRRKTDMLIGNSPQARALLQSLDQLAPSRTPVLITGESGVGKELVARALHFCGPRAKGPFVAINCAAIPENLFEAELFGYQRGAFTGAVNAHAGAFETAHDGTLFLDEIGELPASVQAKLLRVLETSEIQRIGSTDSKKVNFRLVSATNRELDKEVKQGRFREDLYYRILVYPIHVAPLRDRPEDIPPIVTHQLSTIGRRENRPALRLTPSALEKLLAYSWPGNVRELVNLLERAVLLAENRVIDAEHICYQNASSEAEGPALGSYRDAKAKFELEYYSQLMRTVRGNISLASKLGQKTRKEIYDALKRLELDATEYRGTIDPHGREPPKP